MVSQTKLEGTRIVVKGKIQPSIADDILELLDSAVGTNIQVIEIDSTGGRLDSVDHAMKLIRDRQLTVMANNVCASACTNLFIAGSHRVAYEDTIFMVHRPRFEDEQFNDGFTRVFLEPFLEKYDYPTELFNRSVNCRNDFYYSAHDFMKMGIVDEIVSRPSPVFSGKGPLSCPQLKMLIRRQYPSLSESDIDLKIESHCSL
ncbi:MAG: hypothetical protein H6624_05185 [Bdellovibrionaceae bacterium]|nr:hypothetical protein [Bdellovibrionales bacterium]MCB9083712.1 hypothetical protein [Pseudobdellovibrionaceae bacterium]